MTITKEEMLNFSLDYDRGNLPNSLSEKQADDIIRQEIVSIVGTKNPTVRQLRNHEDEIFSIIEVTLDQRLTDGWESNPFFQQFVEYRNLNYGDKNEFYAEDRTMLVASEVAEGHWNLNRQKLDIGDSFAVDVKTYGVKVYTDFLRFLAGRIDYISLINKIELAMKHKIATEIYTNFMSTMDYLPAEFKHSGSMSEDEMLEIVDHVRASNNYAPVVIAGTRKALKELTGTYSGTNSYLVSDRMRDQKNTYGEMERWNGYELLEIPQVHSPNSFDFAIDDNKLMVLPNNTKPIKFVAEGQSLINQRNSATDNMDMSLEYTFLTRFGLATMFNQFYGMYEIVK